MNKLTMPVEVLGEEISVDLEYTLTPGRPARIRYDENDHPAEPAEIDIRDAKVGGVTVPQWFYDAICASDETREYILEHHPSGDDRE